MCPKCGIHLKASVTSKKVRCAKCHNVFAKSDAKRVPPPPPPPPALSSSEVSRRKAVAGGVFVLVFIGLIVSMQPVSLLTGSTMVWAGVMIAGVGVALGLFMSAQRWVRVVAMLVLALALFNACSIERRLSDRRDELTNGSMGSAPSTELTAKASRSAIAPPPTGVAANCSQPPSSVKELIDASFANDERLQDVFAVNGPDGIVYVGGNIMGDDGVKVSSADVWLVIRQPGSYDVYSLSGDARRRTLWPDGRDIASAGDEYGTAVQDCVIKAERARNAGGG